MNERTANPSADPAQSDPAEDPNAPVRDRDIRLLEELADIGAQIARAEGRLALAEIEVAIQNVGEQTKPGPMRHDIRFQRATRTVQMVLAMRTKLLLDRDAWAERVAAAVAAEAKRATETFKATFQATSAAKAAPAKG